MFAEEQTDPTALLIRVTRGGCVARKPCRTNIECNFLYSTMWIRHPIARRARVLSFLLSPELVFTDHIYAVIPNAVETEHDHDCLLKPAVLHRSKGTWTFVRNVQQKVNAKVARRAKKERSCGRRGLNPRGISSSREMQGKLKSAAMDHSATPTYSISREQGKSGVLGIYY